MKIKIKTVIIVGFLFPIIIILCGFLIIACLELGPIVDRPFKPEVKHGEFPFKLTYDINGKRIVVDDVIICDYDGLTTYGGRTSIKWNSTLKSNNDQIVLLDLKDANSQTAKGEKILRLIFDVGTANYYMDDSSRPQSPAQGLEKVFFVKVDSYGNEQIDSMTAQNAFDRYSIELISWECDPPIENSYKIMHSILDYEVFDNVEYGFVLLAVLFIIVVGRNIFKPKA